MSRGSEYGRRFFVVPHTHWDREWYRPFEHFRLELARVVDGVIEALERDPEFASFTLDGQAIVLEDYLEVRPENENRLRALLATGRIEVGPSYVLPDEFLVGPEPLVRNLLIGRAVCRRFGAEPSPIGYLPDSFGHPLQLPQILAGFGLESFIFSRGLGDELDEVGVIFNWQAPNGSSVLAFQQLPDYSNFAEMSDAERGEARVREIVERFGSALDRAGAPDVLLCNGSDHLPVMRELPRVCAELEGRFPGSSFTIARYADYVRAAGVREVPTFTGELLGSRLQNVLRGVNSARLYIKQANERAEQRLLAVETLAALRTLREGHPFPRSDFTLAWRGLLRCHPHDTICGCSCDEVHRDALARYESLHRTLSVLEGQALEGWGDDDAANGTGVVNLLPFRRRGVIERPGFEPALIELDGFSARTVELVAGSDALALERDAGSAVIENDLLRVEAAGDGTLMLVDKENDRRMPGLHALEDEPDMGDLYNFCPTPDSRTWHSGTASARLVTAGPAVSELELRIEAERPAGLDADFRPLRETVPLIVSTIVRLVRGGQWVDFRTTIENAARDHRLRVVFPVGRAGDPVRAEGQFALVRRPLEGLRPRTDWAEPPDPTGHTLGAVAVGPIALFAKGLPEYESRTGPGGVDLCLTLLRCVGVISQPGGALATRPQHAGPQVKTPQGQCLGRHQLEYRLIPGADLRDDLALLRESQDFRFGFLTAPRPHRFDPPLSLDGDVVFSCLKGAEDGDGLILRCFNPSASPATARVGGDVSVSRVKLDETGGEPLEDGLLRLRPDEIGTLRLRPRGARV